MLTLKVDGWNVSQAKWFASQIFDLLTNFSLYLFLRETRLLHMSACADEIKLFKKFNS